jgi:hypothetical protein
MMLSKRLFGALAAVAICAGAACTSSDPTASDRTGTAESPQAVVTSLACTPLFTTQAPLLNCGATAATQVAFASSVQSSITAQMQAAFASLTLTPVASANQVLISSQAAEFAGFFGTQIVAPLSPAGAFTVAVPLTLGAIAPNVTLVANVFGTVPGLITPFATGSPFFSSAPLATINTSANSSISAFNSAAFNLGTLNTAPIDTASISAATMPLTVLVSTPLTATATSPVICSGIVSLGCL